MKNGFDVELTIRAACYRSQMQMVAMQYSLRGQYAIFIAEPLISEVTLSKYSTHYLIFGTGEMVCGQYGLTKQEAKKSMYQRFDDLNGEVAK